MVSKYVITYFVFPAFLTFQFQNFSNVVKLEFVNIVCRMEWNSCRTRRKKASWSNRSCSSSKASHVYLRVTTSHGKLSNLYICFYFVSCISTYWRLKSYVGLEFNYNDPFLSLWPSCWIKEIIEIFSVPFIRVIPRLCRFMCELGCTRTILSSISSLYLVRFVFWNS